ncbi:MAG: 50S ribosomal protein L3 [Candidatus Syntropharchaeia archaeon]
MAKRHRPRRGSLAFSPRKRAKREIPRTRSKSEAEKKLLGFAGYKAGMTHVIMIDNVPNSPTEGLEIFCAATVIETPPMRVIGVRAYKEGVYGKKAIAEARNEDSLSKIEKLLSEINEIRLITSTMPHIVSGIPKKKPEIMEQYLGGSVEEGFEYASEMLGREIGVSEVFEKGEFVDVIAVTKGKGTQGPVKRWGVTIQDRKALRSSKGRHVGTLGPWHPARVRWRVPQLGQTGYHQRTEYNKRILEMGKGEEITPKGGFVNYGIVRNDYLLIAGSVPGPKKRLIRIRPAIRKHPILDPPEIIYISKESKQG